MVTTLSQDQDLQDELDYRLRRDLRQAAALLSPTEARFLVDTYYQMQEDRKRASNQVRSMESEPHTLLSWVAERTGALEGSIRSALGVYAAHNPVGRWSMSIVGIGPVISAGLLAHIDIERAPTAGHIWNFAGLNPGVTWEKGEKRPWNAGLRTLCWKVGESFVKTQNHEHSFYGPLYRERRAIEEAQNASGALADQAAAKLDRFKIGKATTAYAAYSQGILPDAHIYARSKRWVVKLFLSHWHSVAYQVRYGREPPVPYALTLPNHAHLIQPPNWPM